MHQEALRDAFAEVSHFRSELYACLTARGDALFELCDALLCTGGPVRTVVDLALAPEHRRGHGALYGGLNQGRIDVARLRRALAGVVNDAQRFMAALISMVAASGVLSVLHWAMLPLLLLAVLPAGVGAVLSARVDYEMHYANVSDRNVRHMMRWWATTPKHGDEVRANGMTGYLLFWYRSLSERIDRRLLDAAPRTLRITLLSSAAGGVFLLLAWGALAWLAITGRTN
ncbi:putative ABC transport protein [Streptomyces viridochromogenes Tue57]|uniref:Putative ABC transport protein n=1 Tax=Streptomyces viridochromogenes Tue57 TaxID=1160705 RepID=L8PS94_STRVR|nr:putative ABC transport protein [Streptomyces viridochromogenes Tue57]